MDMLLFITSAAHIVYTPFTKVEESFNLQAIHDILYLRHNFTEYDHHEFPGVVPRTFLGPLFISILASPFIMLFEALEVNKYWSLYIVRLVLSAIVACAWTKLKRVITKHYGSDVSLWFSLITLTQFHFIFYMSRPLPNIMALPIVLYALAYWLNDQTKPFIICSGIAILVFRSELIIFLGILLLLHLLYQKVTIARILKIALPAGIIILVSTIAVDSFFWKRLLWPEGEVLWYNTILNKSSDWGTSPFLWYFYSALPRAMAGSLVFVPIGLILERRIRPIVLAALGFVAIYSILPHKELRFIIYVFPVLNLAAATACHRLWSNSAKSVFHGFLALCAGGHLLLNICVTLFLLVVSGTNYPGGVALTHLHSLEAGSTNVSVHISNLAAQSGVSRFLQIHDDWSYCKKEQMNYTKEEALQYTHLIVEAKNKLNNELWSSLQDDFDNMDYVDCFNSIGIQYSSLMPIKIKTKPCLAILKRKPGRGTTVSTKEGEKKKDSKKRKKKSLDEEMLNDDPKTEEHHTMEKKSKRSLETKDDFEEPNEAMDEKLQNKAKDKKRKTKSLDGVQDGNMMANQNEGKERDSRDEMEEKSPNKIKDKKRKLKADEIENQPKDKKIEDSLETSKENAYAKSSDKEPIKEIIEEENELDEIPPLSKEIRSESIDNQDGDNVSLEIEAIDEDIEIPQPNQIIDNVSLEDKDLTADIDDDEEFQEQEIQMPQHTSPLSSKENDLPTLLGSAVSLEDDAIVSTVESYEDLPHSEEINENDTPVHKEINFQELRNLALGQVNRKTKATKLKIRRLIEQHFRAKGKHIENDSLEKQDHSKNQKQTLSPKQSVKAIIKQERIKEMIEQIATMDLTKLCNLDKVSTKDCLKSVIDKIDAEDKSANHHS
ncbi:alg12 alpha-1,6-mannosyltransferase [Haematobia irritans]|uniref:alg12 alpha-1,6-mannosyltransferase n=1 Tax=Haematobia irritans TaxID=7368 RepID=UPI003F4F7E8B